VQAMQAMLQLSSMFLAAWPGPGVIKNKPACTPAEAAAAAAALGPSSSGVCYQTVELPLAVSFAARLSSILCGVAYAGRGEAACVSALKRGLPPHVLEVLASPEAHHVLQVGFMVAAYERYKSSTRHRPSACSRTESTSKGSKAGHAKSSSVPPAVAPWHEQLAEALNLSGALDLLSVPMGRGADSVNIPEMAKALRCCMEARRSSGRSTAAGAVAAAPQLADPQNLPRPLLHGL